MTRFNAILLVSDAQNPEKNLLCSLGRKWLYQRIRRSCRKKLLYKRVPIASWIQKYRKDYIVSDLVAGITVGLTVIPQAIAYANVAGLPLQVRTYYMSVYLWKTLAIQTPKTPSFFLLHEFFLLHYYYYYHHPITLRIIIIHTYEIFLG